MIRELSPRCIQFSGHGDAVKRGAFAGALAFETHEGKIQLPSPDAFIQLLKACKNLECVYLNGCKTLHPLGAAIQAELPHILIIGWESIAADAAAFAFSKGFYDQLGAAVEQGGISTTPNFMAAYEAGVRAFSDAGFVWGDPERLGHNKVHGAFGVLLRHHDKVTKFISRMRSGSSGKGMREGGA